MEKKIAEILKGVHMELYGHNPMDSVFLGGNVGNAILAFKIEESAKEISIEMRRLSIALEKYLNKEI